MVEIKSMIQVLEGDRVENAEFRNIMIAWMKQHIKHAQFHFSGGESGFCNVLRSNKGLIPDVSSTSINYQQGNPDVLFDDAYPLMESPEMMSEEENSDSACHGVKVKLGQPIGSEKSFPSITVCKRSSQLKFLSHKLRVPRLLSVSKTYFIDEFKESDFWSAYRLKLPRTTKHTNFFGVFHAVWGFKHRKPPDYMNFALLASSYVPFEESTTPPPLDYSHHSVVKKSLHLVNLLLALLSGIRTFPDSDQNEEVFSTWQLRTNAEVPFLWDKNEIEYYMFIADGFSLFVGEIYEGVYMSLIQAVEIVDNIIEQNFDIKQAHNVCIQFSKLTSCVHIQVDGQNHKDTNERSFLDAAEKSSMQKRGEISKKHWGSIKAEKEVRKLWIIPWQEGTNKDDTSSYWELMTMRMVRGTIVAVRKSGFVIYLRAEHQLIALWHHWTLLEASLEDKTFLKARVVIGIR